MSIEWTTNADGAYEVSSAAHLLQIMNKGALGTDTGTPPVDYWAASYLQTQDIDLANDHASIVPIGVSSDRFTGTYDGGLFQIQNWSHSQIETYAGLFGYCDGATLRKIRLSGVWEILGNNNYTGLICGRFTGSTAYDVEGDFADGTAFGDRSTDTIGGGLFGWVEASDVQGATVRGSVHFTTNTRDTPRGGVAGRVTGGSHTLWRNLASFPNGITGGNAGGLLGDGSQFSLSKCQNSMNGNIVGTTAGGIIGYMDHDGLGGTQLVEFTVNSMTGNITSTTGGAGGIVGETSVGYDQWRPDVIATKAFNVMRGDIAGASGAGGIIGTIGGKSGFVFSITKSIVAMQGTVDQSVRGAEDIAPSEIEATVDTTFGMISTGNDYGSATMVVDDAFVYDPSFTDLPYFEMSGTDAEGTVYTRDFVYANIGGKTPEYTHLSVHTSDVSAPYFTDFGLGDSNTVVYLTYANTDTNTLFHDASLTIVQTAAATIVQTGAVPGDAGGDDPTAGLDGTTTKDDFLFGDVYDITEAGTQVSAAANDLFATGDAVAVNVNHSSTTTTFVNRGDEIGVVGVNALLLPFDPEVTDVQDATFTLSDATSVSVGFDQSSGNIVVDGTTYSNGDYFIMDGQKVTVYDI